MRRFTVREAAAYLGVSAGLVYALCAARKIRHERHGIGRGRILIPEDSLEEYRRSRTVEVAAPEPESPRPRAAGTFKHLDPERLRRAWKEQGALPD